MKKIFYLLAVVGVVLTGCKDNNSPENGNDAFTFTEDVSKPLEFDGGSAKRALNFTAQADWSVSIQQGASKTQAKKSPQKAAENSVTWITVSPMSGQKGTQQITITCAPNDQNEERSATITISDGKNELKITIVQEALSGDFDVFMAMNDRIFKKYCEQFDTDKDGKLSLTEAQAVKEIDGVNARSFKGIEYFTNLERFALYNQEVAAFVSLDMSNKTKLTHLICGDDDYDSYLESLNVSGCIALEELQCMNGQLTSLDVSSCTALKKLYCSNNQLTSLDVSNCTVLEGLYCRDNQLTSLNVSGCTALKDFNFRHNQLTSLDLSDCTALRYPLYQGNPLKTIYLKKGVEYGLDINVFIDAGIEVIYK